VAESILSPGYQSSEAGLMPLNTSGRLTPPGVLDIPFYVLFNRSG
jgi:hypothetical protein